MSRAPRRPIIEPTLLDTAISFVAPRWALRRLGARASYMALTGGGYHGASKTRRATRTWSPTGGSADADIVPDLPTLRDRTRDLERNTPIATGAINRKATNVVGPGLRVAPQIDRKLLGLDEERAAAIEARARLLFHGWAVSPDCDASGVQSFYGLQDLAFRAVLQSGDCFIVPLLAAPASGALSGLSLLAYEADQVSNPVGARNGAEKDDVRIVDGVGLGKHGAPDAYYFAKVHPGNIAGRYSGEHERIAARDEDGRRQVWHLYRRRRIGQTRGVPELAPVIEALKQLANYTEAELMAAVIGAMITVVYKGSGDPLPNTDPNDPGYSSTSSDDAAREYRMKSGTVMEIEHDAEVSVPTLGRPNSGFDPFFVAILRQIGAALDLPFEVLILHFTASYSASRAALEMAWQSFRQQREWLIEVLCRPAYEARIGEAVALGQLDMPGFFSDPVARHAWLGAAWIGPRRVSIDPKKENEADEIAVRRGWKTDSEVTAETTGGDWDRKIEQRGKEEKQRREHGVVQPATRAPATPAAPPDDDESGDSDMEDNS